MHPGRSQDHRQGRAFWGRGVCGLLRETDLGNGFRLAERLRQQISGGAIEARGKKIVGVTASVGLAMAHRTTVT
jgi:PleD family two-component response regulator